MSSVQIRDVRKSFGGFEVLHGVSVDIADGEFVKRGRLLRAGCDPYQEAWCEARANVGADLPRGDVEVRTERAKLCQNDGSDGNGFIHAFGMPTD